jgi:hypothetical protein
MSQNPASIASNIAAQAGFFIRVMDFGINLEFIMDSGLNKVGLFDTYYFGTRQFRYTEAMLWMSNKLASSTINISEYNFGFRAKLRYNFLKYVVLESFYQLTFSTGTTTSMGIDIAPSISDFRYHDKLYLKLALDSVDRWKVNLSLYIMWQVADIGLAFSNAKFFQLADTIYAGIKIVTHKSVDINLAIGLYPDYVTFKAPWYSQFMLDFYITIRPIPFFELKKEQETMINL